MDIFNRALGRPPTNNEISYFNYSASRNRNILSDTTMNMIAAHKKQVYDNSLSEEAINRLKDEQLFVGESLGTDRIMKIDNYNNVGSVMQKYIMHNPKIYDMFNKNLISGYSDTLNLKHDIDVKNTDEYLKTMSGWVNDDSDEYAVEYIDGEDDLTFREQCIVQDTWKDIQNLLVDDDIT